MRASGSPGLVKKMIWRDCSEVQSSRYRTAATASPLVWFRMRHAESLPAMSVGVARMLRSQALTAQWRRATLTSLPIVE